MDDVALEDLKGMCICPHTRVAPATLKNLRSNGIIGLNDRTVVVSISHGMNFTQYKIDYHSKVIPDVKSEYENPPFLGLIGA